MKRHEFDEKIIGKLKGVAEQLRGLEYQISWGTMTLQDAVDFCLLAIKTTEAMQRFSDGIAMNPGDVPGVGGEIDIAVITRDNGFVWVKKKNVRVDDREINLDEVISKPPKNPLFFERSREVPRGEAIVVLDKLEQ